MQKCTRSLCINKWPCVICQHKFGNISPQRALFLGVCTRQLASGSPKTGKGVQLTVTLLEGEQDRALYYFVFISATEHKVFAVLIFDPVVSFFVGKLIEMARMLLYLWSQLFQIREHFRLLL